MKFDTTILGEIAAALEKAADVAKAKAAQHTQAREFALAGTESARLARNSTWAKSLRAAIAYIDDKPKAAKKPKKLAGEDSEEFGMFWAAYPKKIGKGEARRAWDALKCDGKLQPILRAVGVARDSADWKKDGGQFIPHPATWIRREGWSDEMKAPTCARRVEPADGDPVGWREFLKVKAIPYEPHRFAIDWMKTDFREWVKEQSNAG